MRSFEREAFRLENLDTYALPRLADHFRAFMAGEEQPESFLKSPWVDTVRDAAQSGKRIYRVHALSRPLTDYLRYELAWGYHRNADAGEEIFILDTTGRESPLDGVPDFWMFDESAVSVMHYDEGGAFLRSEVLSEERTAQFMGYRDVALSQAQPFFDWWEAYGAE